MNNYKPISPLLHFWYKLTEPNVKDRLYGMGPKRFYVRYYDGRSIAMAYDIACDYAEMFNGTVHKIETENPSRIKE